jgi:L-rhamnose mutarotase
MNPSNINQPDNGYISNCYPFKTKRYIKTLTLANDPTLINEYKSLHSEERSWKIIRDGIRSVGILEMELFIYETTVCMIIETPIDLDLDLAMKKLAELPKQQEWEDLVSSVQKSEVGKTSADKWHLMERFFHLY